mgnify:CR=1 FL=1
MRDKKKILIYINQICLRGGVEKVFYNLINNIDISKYDITVLTTVAYLKDDLKINIYGDKVKRYFLAYDEFSSHFMERTYERIYNKIAHNILRTYLSKQHWDVAIAAQEGCYAKFIADVNADKKLLWIHNDFNETDWSKKYFNNRREDEAKCYNEFDNVICVSESVKNSIERTLGLSDNLCVCYNPIDTKEIDEKVGEKVSEKRPKELLFLMVGRLSYQKGYDRVLKAVNELNKEGYNFNIWILGDGEDRGSIEEYIKINKINNVELLGNKKNPFPYMKMADCILSTSRFEGFNTALQEAAYIGKPIITTECAGAKELLGDSEYGIVMKNDDDEIYRTLKIVLDDNKIILNYQNKVREIKKFIDINQRIKKIESLF